MRIKFPQQLILLILPYLFLLSASELKLSLDQAPNFKISQTSLEGAEEDLERVYWSRAFSDVYRVLLMNLRAPEPPFTSHYVLPGPKFKKEVYLWDTAFIAEVWKWWEPEIASEIFSPLFQFAEEGMIPHCISPGGKIKDSQPPVLSWAVWRIYQIHPDRAWLEKVYPYLRDYNAWFYRERRLENGLFFWANPFESGMDNSPRFTNRSATKIIPMRKIAGVDLCSYLVKDNLTLSEMAKALGREEEAREYQTRADELKARVNKYLWEESEGLYYDYDFGKSQWVKVKSIASFLPLFAGVPEPGQAKKLVGHLMNAREFNSLIPLGSVSLDDPSFQLDMWRGPVWINTAYLIILGLNDYGYNKEAGELSWKIIDGVFRVWERTGKFYEFYHPEKYEIKGLHRKTGNLGTNFSRGDAPAEDFIGWTGLVNNLVIEELFGLRKQGSSFTLCPNLPALAEGYDLSLSLPSQNLQIFLKRKSAGQTEGKIIQKQNQMSFELEPGKSFSWSD